MLIKKFIPFFLLFPLLLGGFSCKQSEAEIEAALKPIKLTYWRVWDSPKDFGEIIDKYRALHPNISIEIRNFRFEEYEGKLLEALAEDRGPDIFSLPSSFIPRYENRIAPLPEEITLTYTTKKKTLGLKEETFIEKRKSKTFSPETIKTEFTKAVADEIISKENKIYGLPLALDTLAIYYNVSLLDNAGIPLPANTWAEMQKHAPLLTKQDKEGRIIQSAISLGGSNNVERSFDILSLLMMQNGAPMMTPGKSTVTFTDIPIGREGITVPPGEDALRFYAEFSDPSKSVYTWNGTLENSLDLFLNGKLAYFIGYAYHQPFIRAQAPKLNFKIIPMLQVDQGNPINYINYWIETVSKKSSYQNEAWDFIQFAISSKNVTSYLDKTKKPPALRKLFDQYKNDLSVGVFTEQILTAQNWYQGKNPSAAELFFKEMIDSVINGTKDVKKALQDARAKIQQTL